MWRASQTPRVEKVQFHLLFSDLSTCHYIIIILFDHLSFPDSATCFHVWSRFIFLLVHMLSLGFVMCHYLLWPCVLSQFSQVPLSYQATSPFQVHPRLFFGVPTCHFRVSPRIVSRFDNAAFSYWHTCALEHRPCGLFLFIRVSVHDFYTCTFIVLLYVCFRMPRIRNLDIARVHIKCRRSYRSMTSYNNQWYIIIIPRKYTTIN